MALFGRKTERGAQPPGPGGPDRALPMLSPAQATRLRELYAGELGRLGFQVSIAPDHLGVPGSERTFGLWNLAAKLAGAPETEWPALVRQHAEVVVAGLEGPSKPLDLDRLLVRLVERGATVAQHLRYAAPWMPGVVIAFAIDHEDTIGTVTDARVAELGDLAQAYDRGLRLLDAEFHNAEIDLVPVPSPAEARFVVAAADWQYMSSIPLLLPSAMSVLAKGADLSGGILFAVPDRHQFVFHVISSPRGAMEALMQMPQYASHAYGRGVSPLSPSVYLWRAGEVTQLSEVAGGELRVTPGAYLESLFAEMD